jgi:hypothetical protein
MRAQNAAPEGDAAKRPSGNGSINGVAASISPLELPAHIRARLAVEGVNSLADWAALGQRRLQLFGVTKRTAAQLDALSEEAAK